MVTRPYRMQLKSSDDLVTTDKAVREYFVAEAFERNRRATPFVAQARALKVAASYGKTPAQLMRTKNIQAALLTAAGVSDKFLAYLQPEDTHEALQGLIKNFLEPAGANFVEELVFRFLLHCGDTLSGSMRNVGGALAQRKIARAIISALAITGRPYRWLQVLTNVWAPMTDDDADIELYLRGLSWKQGKEDRTLIFNLTVPLVKNNVDLCLFNCNPDQLTKDSLSTAGLYVAFGELKGGIDPAGADEHWKTARTALSRIQKAFAKYRKKPYTFFVGAAIERKMANEIWNELRSGTLTNAANLTDDTQIALVSRWLCNI